MDITESFDATYHSEETFETIALIGDITFDEIINGGVLDGIPVFGLMRNIYKTTKQIQIKHLINKVYRFIFLTKDTTLNERIKFIKEYTEKNKENGCEALITVIDKLDNINKIDILTNLMKAKIKEYINIENFIRLCAIIDRIPFPDFKEMLKYTKDYYEDDSTEILLSAGVLFNTAIGSNESNKYRLNSLGEKLLKYGLLENVSVEIQKYTIQENLVWDGD